MKKNIYRVLSLFLLGVLVFSITACEKREQIPALVYDEDVGYNFTAYLGENLDAVLEQLQAADILYEKNEAYPENQAIYNLTETIYDVEAQVRLYFYQANNSKQMRLIHIERFVRLPAWPDAGERITQGIQEDYASLVEQYGDLELGHKSYNLRNPSKMMENPADCYASWHFLDDKDMEVSFSVSTGSGEFLYGLSFSQKSGRKQFFEDQGLEYPY